ncbi:MAG: FdhF/YdeP family oxidoreductase [Rhodanobacteraceae bacterium]
MSDKDRNKGIRGIRPYHWPAGGWGSLRATGRALNRQGILLDGGRTLARLNQPDGFDCMSCAWPDQHPPRHFEFCENGAKAVAWEATERRADAIFFDAHTVSELWQWSDHDLEDAGRLSQPMVYDADSDRYRPTTWGHAFARIGKILHELDHPDRLELYTSGRASNEAAFLYQLFGRRFGTNNFPDCSNMCHEPTSAGMPKSLGVGKATVTLEDFDNCDAIFCIGHNPGTNHPRMLGVLSKAARRGCRIVAFNPMRERGLERFADPQSPKEMATLTATDIANHYYQLRIGGDIAMLKGLMKTLLAMDEADGGKTLDHAFISEHANGFEALKANLDATAWDDIERVSGLSRGDIEAAAGVYAEAERVIVCYGMGITQQRHGTANVQQIANLLLLRGNIGKPGAGMSPLRGHSNVQGDRTMGINHAPPESFLQRLGAHFGFEPPRKPGHTVLDAIPAMVRGDSKALICLGGNLAVAAPDPDTSFAALRELKLTVHIATKLNRTHLAHGQQSILLPCLGRSEIDRQRSGEQSVTVEDSMCTVRASKGSREPASGELRSECAIIAGIAQATLPDSGIDWQRLIDNYDHIRDAIAAVLPELFAGFNQRLAEAPDFYLRNPARERQWHTASGKAEFLTVDGLAEDEYCHDKDVLTLTTVRSHEQFNTTIYSDDDRYRGVFGRRDVLFMAAADVHARGFTPGQRVTVSAADHPERQRELTVVVRELPRGSAAMYYPESNALISLDRFDGPSKVPAFKSVPVRLRAL